ncbi:unnamed protein product [Cuscuta epithymum]|uniref:Phytol kinase n=3 Tax=Cuscuta epithymum TaxID=186058 RepID=A0AAV0DXF3_9ASTE|nr:unnamed protein product [Cuscuta epithymum]
MNPILDSTASHMSSTAKSFRSHMALPGRRWKCRMPTTARILTPFSLRLIKTGSFSYLTHSPLLATDHIRLASRKSKRPEVRSQAVSSTMFSSNLVAGDLIAFVMSGGVAFSCLRFWEEIAKRGIFEQNLNRKFVHITMGHVFMLCWPMFSPGHQGALLAALIPGINIVKVLLLGLGILKDDATIKSMSRFGDYRELLKGPLYYALTITLACAVFWRTSPVAIALICNLCAGDGMADIVGRRIKSRKLPYNRNKSIAGSIAMAASGFLSSIGYMQYFSSFGYLQKTSHMVIGFLIVSIASALVESHPLSTELDDNLTVPLTSVLLGSFVF